MSKVLMAILVQFVVTSLIFVFVNCVPGYVHLHNQDEIHESNFVLLDEPQLCPSSSSNLLIAIKTSPTNRVQRDAVRQTWLVTAKQLNIPHVFVMGSTKDEKVLDSVLDETRSTRDIIIGRPIDNYFNLTLKALFLYSWTRTYCPNKWILYVDDDTLVNLNNIHEFLNPVPFPAGVSKELRLAREVPNPSAIYCRALRNYPVIRDTNWKWFVSKEVYGPDRYPDYCLGNQLILIKF